MKKIVIALLTILVVLIAGLTYLYKSSPTSQYAGLYDDATHITYDQLLTDDVEGTNLFYFYQETCSHCNAIKNDVAKFYYNNKDENIDFYLVDGADPKNQDIWYQGAKEDFVAPSGPVTADTDIKIQGTPTLIEIKDGEITQFLVGDTDIPAYLESLNA